MASGGLGRNLIGNGVPFATVDLSFSAVAPARTLPADVNGHMVLDDAIARVIDTNGPSAYGNLNVTCTYAGISTSVEVPFEDATTVYCDLPLSNQAPFVNWTSPEDETTFPSNGEVHFDASTSWDLDDDPLTFRWISSIDGDILSSCQGSTGSSGSTHATRGGSLLRQRQRSVGLHVERRRPRHRFGSVRPEPLCLP